MFKRRGFFLQETTPGFLGGGRLKIFAFGLQACEFNDAYCNDCNNSCMCVYAYGQYIVETGRRRRRVVDANEFHLVGWLSKTVGSRPVNSFKICTKVTKPLSCHLLSIFSSNYYDDITRERIKPKEMREKVTRMNCSLGTFLHIFPLEKSEEFTTCIYIQVCTSISSSTSHLSSKAKLISFGLLISPRI